MTDVFSLHITSMHGDAGQTWLDSIPQLIKTCEEKWEIKVLPPFTLNYNYVAPVKTNDGLPAVLKIGFPGDKGFFSEMEMLTLCNGEGLIKLLQYEPTHSVALIEQCIPGKSLRGVEEKEAIPIAASLMQNMWRPAPQEKIFPTIKDWGKAFERVRNHYGPTSGPIPPELLEKAEKLFIELVKSSDQQFLLHGDLHHDNILLSDRGWLAIDPKGVIGEKAYEVGIWLRNPYPDILTLPNVLEIFRNRIVAFAHELSLDKERILAWGFAQAVLSACWVVEDREQYLDYYLSCAQLLSNLQL